ncbi:MAG: helical backbone metal receptor [Bacteroidota bacterium]
MLHRLLPALLAVLALAGCRPQSSASTGDGGASAADSVHTVSMHTVQDDLGRSVRLPQSPQRIVPLAPSVTELVAAAGGLDQLAARTPYCNAPEAALALRPISTYPLDREALVAVQTDLVIGTDQVNDPSVGDGLSTLGIPAFYLNFRTLADVPRTLRVVGDLLGTRDVAEAAAQRFEARIGNTPPADPDAPRVLVLIGDDILYGFGEASYVHALVARAGGRSITAQLEGEGVTLSSEWVLTQAPEVIGVLAGADYRTDDLRTAQPAWKDVPALQNEAVCGLDPDLISRPGPRLADGMDALAACIAAAHG